MTPGSLDICICTMDLAGPIRNGGIGTAYRALACLLAEAGHRVTVLLALGDHCENGAIGDWIEHYRKLGIELIPLPESNELIIAHGADAAVSFRCYQWLAEREAAGRGFDCIHFHEWRGPGFYSTLAKREGLNFRRTVICIGTHSPVLWHLFGMRRQPRLEDLQADWLERGSVRWADVVVSPSHYMLDWMRRQKWTLPERQEVIQYILTDVSPVAQRVQPINEIVFFGRLETRKGLALFCDALDLLAADVGGGKFSIAFLGKRSRVGDVDAAEFIADRAAKWPFAWRIVDNLDRAGAMEFLKQPGRLAVAPSLVENLPLTVLECLGNGIPILCTDLPGNRELVAPADATRALFAPRPSDLFAKLRAAIEGGIQPAMPAVSPEQTKTAWLEWHKSIVASQPAAINVSDSRPLVSVCLTHFNRPDKLAQALDSLRAQDYPNLEVVLVDDGSTLPEANRFLDSLQEDFARRSWRLIRQQNQYLGAARNAAAKAARGQWLLFMDDDNSAMPDEVTTFVRAAENSGAAILTCVPAYFHGDDAPRPGITPRELAPPLGGALALGLFSNCFGDANGFFRRDVFESLGGFTQDVGLGFEDWELYAKAALAGHDILVVPRPLYWYRIDARSMVRSTNRFENQMRSLRPYLEKLGPEVGQALLLAQGLYFNPSIPVAAVAAAGPDELPMDPQQLVDEYLNSWSWRMTGAARRAAGRMLGMPPALRPKVHNQQEAFAAIAEINRSMSWEATGPVRVLGRIWARLRSRRRSNGRH
ncbi:MAG TPA: glycosyltransferase [Tepidisphaeraceae bacterium]|nr:glycosyltransferase [Tepidisphaeraceae bacterium]